MIDSTLGRIFFNVLEGFDEVTSRLGEVGIDVKNIGAVISLSF